MLDNRQMSNFQDQRRALRKAEGVHIMGPECWCGHGSPEVQPQGFDIIDGAHTMMRIPHRKDCSQDCKAFHFHYHCAECAMEVNKESCCV